ncbi:hypothetical protein ACFL2H_10945 [Planctomycetota bacterium]
MLDPVVHHAWHNSEPISDFAVDGGFGVSQFGGLAGGGGEESLSAGCGSWVMLAGRC